MGAVPVNGDGLRDTELTERDNLRQDEQKGLRNVVVGGAQGFGSSEEDEKRSHVIIREINKVSEGAIQVPPGPQNSQPQGSVIHWETFLPIRSLKVLLVENDDSTRHIVSALLRNCSYEVTAVANGLQAWKILEDFTNHVDIVLTEVVMPFISGFGLLCKIMSHKTFKNIPVIMMSSHDSMNLVFKCLSKGAVDFLVKPIRKNELKNLWQHVWRRCHSSSGSGSESGTQSEKYVRSKNNGESETNTGRSDEHDNGSVGLSIQDGSDNGSATQSSWTKRAAEVDSPQPLSPLDPLADAPDSTCAQVIRAKPETFSSAWVHVTERKECQKQDGQTENVAMGKDLEIGIFRDTQSQLEHQHKLPTQPNSKIQDQLSELDSKHLEKEYPEIKRENISGKQRGNAANLIGAIRSCIDQQVESRTIDAPSGVSNTSRIKDKSSNDSRELPSLELTLKRLRGVGDIGTSVHENHNVLRHSNLSAFSKYNTACSANQAPTGNVGSCSPLDNSSIAMNKEIMDNSNSTPPNQQSNGSSNNNDMASTTKCVTKKLVPEKAVDVEVSMEKLHAKGSDHPVPVQHRRHHYHHHHHHHDVQNMLLQPQLDRDDLSLKNMAAAPQCGSSNMFGGPVEGNAANYSVNGSASGSNHGSNGQNGSSNALNAGATNIESDNGVAGNSGVIGVGGSSNGNATDEDRLAQREAALTKFRQKRKERCFEKKVRYQSRKRLAEQRPRVRGQFVRQSVSSSKVLKNRQDNVEAEDNSPDNEQ